MKLLCKGFVKDNLTRAIFYMTCIKASTLKNNTKKALCRARQVGVNLLFRLQFHNYDECRTDSTDIFTIWHFFLYLRLWWKYNFYKGSHYKHKETSLRKVLEVNPLWESCLYEVAEAAFSPNVLHTHIWNPSNFCFLLFCFGAFFQLHRDRGVKGGYQILSWNESQTQVIHA